MVFIQKRKVQKNYYKNLPENVLNDLYLWIGKTLKIEISNNKWKNEG